MISVHFEDTCFERVQLLQYLWQLVLPFDGNFDACPSALYPIHTNLNPLILQSNEHFGMVR
jgi:hypothetical protein